MNNSNPIEHQALGHALVPATRIAEAMACWLVRTGVGYGACTQALKAAFFKAGYAELLRQGQKPTASALSLVSGLHRKDVSELLKNQEAVSDRAATGAIDSKANQVFTRWLANQWPDSIAVVGSEQSFEQLARSVSKDLHPRAVLNELTRLRLVRETEDGQVQLLKRAFMLDPGAQAAQKVLAEAVHDHLLAGVHNLTQTDLPQFLEQSVFADGLKEASVEQLQQLSSKLWRDVLSAMVEAAVPLSERDEVAGGNQRIRVGMYFYTEPMQEKTQKAHASVVQ